MFGEVIDHAATLGFIHPTTGAALTVTLALPKRGLVIEPGRTEVGATTSAWDTLVRHVYAVDLAYDNVNDSFVGALDYIYDRWYPILKLHVGRENLFERDDDNKATRVRHADTHQGAQPDQRACEQVGDGRYQFGVGI